MSHSTKKQVISDMFFVAISWLSTDTEQDKPNTTKANNTGPKPQKTQKAT